MLKFPLNFIFIHHLHGFNNI